VAFLVRSPEPLDWRRTGLEVLLAERAAARPLLPGAVKLTAVRFPPEPAFVELLLRESADLKGLRIEVRLPGPRWELYFQSAAEPLLPAGRRIRVYPAGAAVPASEPGILQRFAAPAAPPLPAAGTRFRLVVPAETRWHARLFLPDAAYRAVAVRLLRKADGTSFFLLPAPPASAFPSGQYRWRWTYRRDNRAASPGSPILSQAGDSSPERVTLDIPWELVVSPPPGSP